ncbi:MAG: hypothetical protein EBU32_05050 [Opitutaceae bacterium]|nr:hypothetical protein [Opitutaceae bacterium]
MKPKENYHRHWVVKQSPKTVHYLKPRYNAANGHKKSGAQIAPPNHAAEIYNELSRKRLRLNFPAANQKELLLLFRSNFLFCDGFLNRFFRGSGLGGFFGHEKLLASFFMNGTQNFSFLRSLFHPPFSALTMP